MPINGKIMRLLIILPIILFPVMAFAQGAPDQTVQSISEELQALSTQVKHLGPAIMPLVQERDTLKMQVKQLTEENVKLKAEAAKTTNEQDKK
jgi:uncharacterized membrane protein affecting hemolysin expression